jgi:hypothetical protein
VLFGQEPSEHLRGAAITERGLLAPGATTGFDVADCRIHLEFRTPFMPTARGQGRGNSGVYIQQRYEVQILDSFGLAGAANECGGLYRQAAPDVNMCLPPLSWQTYDILFTAARWDDEGNKTAPARISVWHNGELIHAQRPLTSQTGAGRSEGADPRPIHLQFHGNPVEFRNFWIVPGAQDMRCIVTRHMSSSCGPG